MITINSTNESVRFVFYTLGLTEEMIKNEEAGRIGTKTILNLIDSDIYPKAKAKLLQIQTLPRIELTSNDFFTFCVLIDFCGRCLVSDIFNKRLNAIHRKKPFDNQSTFAEIDLFYRKYATKYFNDIRELFKDNDTVLEILNQATNWDMNDEQFK